MKKHSDVFHFGDGGWVEMKTEENSCTSTDALQTKSKENNKQQQNSSTGCDAESKEKEEENSYTGCDAESKEEGGEGHLCDG